MATSATAADIQTTIFKALETFGADPADINRDAGFEALDIDSLDLAELAQIVDEKWGVTLSSGDLQSITTVGDVLDLIADRV